MAASFFFIVERTSRECSPLFAFFLSSAERCFFCTACSADSSRSSSSSTTSAPNTHQIETRILEQTREIDNRLQRQEEKFTKLFQDERDKDQIKREDARDKEQLTRKDANKNAREAVEKERFDKLHLEMKDLKTSIVERDKADELKELRKANALLVECLKKDSAGGPSRSLIIVLLNL